MNEYEKLKALIERVRLAEEYFEKEHTEKKTGEALEKLQGILKDIVELTLILQNKYGKVDFERLYVVEQEQLEFTKEAFKK